MCISTVYASTPERPPGSKPAVGSLATPTTSLPPTTGVPAAAAVVPAGAAVVGDAAATGEPAVLGAVVPATDDAAAAVGCPALTGRAVGTAVAVACGAAGVAVGAGLPPHASRIIVIVDAESPITAARRRNARRVIRP